MTNPQEADDKVVLGIHTNAAPNPSAWEIDTDGHAWLTITRNGHTQAYGLWPNDHPRFADEARHPDSNIRVGIENGFASTADRYYELNAEQVKALDAALKENVTWGYTNNCSTWATSTAEKVTGEHIQAKDNYGLTTPGDLANGIQKLEKQQPTSRDKAAPHVEPSPSSSFHQAPASPDQEGRPDKQVDGAKAQTGDRYVDNLLMAMDDPAAFKQAMTDLTNSPYGQDFRAHGQMQNEALVSQQAQAQAAQQQVLEHQQTGPVMRL